jgi:hypothetical protein
MTAVLVLGAFYVLLATGARWAAAPLLHADPAAGETGHAAAGFSVYS